MSNDKKNIIIYNTVDGKAAVSLYARDGMVWMNQSQIAELFDTSVPNISMHISNIMKEGELEENSGYGASGEPSFGSGPTETSRNTWSRAL